MHISGVPVEQHELRELTKSAMQLPSNDCPKKAYYLVLAAGRYAKIERTDHGFVCHNYVGHEIPGTLEAFLKPHSEDPDCQGIILKK